MPDILVQAHTEINAILITWSKPEYIHSISRYALISLFGVNYIDFTRLSKWFFPLFLICIQEIIEFLLLFHDMK